MRRELKIFSGSSHPELAKAICEYNEIPLGASETIKFSNENIMVRLLQMYEAPMCLSFRLHAHR